jgi:hypothetical protein
MFEEPGVVDDYNPISHMAMDQHLCYMYYY